VRSTVLAVLGAIALAVWATWPIAAHLGTHVYDPSRHGGFFAASIRADIRLVLWILAWDVHALSTAPARLWDANIFHPAPHALALSEHLLGALPVYAPIAAASRCPVFAHQATLLVTFVGALLAMGALARAWTARWPAAVVAATLFAFSPFRSAHLGALQIEGCWMLPLLPLAAWRSTTRPGWAWPLVLALVLTLTALHSVYLAYGAFAGMAVLAAVVLAGDPAARRAGGRLVLPLAAAAAVVGVSALPYLAMRTGGALAHPRDEFVELASAPLGQTGATLAAALALVSLPWWRRGVVGDLHPAWLVGVAAAGGASHLLALGPAIHLGPVELPGPYALAARIVPGFEALRIPLRFNAFATACTALLAGVGASAMIGAAPDERRARLRAAGVLMVALVAPALAFRGPVPLERIETRNTIPPIYATLARLPVGPVLELPWHDFERLPMERADDAVRTYRSVYHWRPLLNGYSGYAPPTYGVVSALVHAAPDPRALTLLARTTGLRYVLVHTGGLDADAARVWERAAGDTITEVGREGMDVLYALAHPVEADLQPAFVGEARATATLTGTPLAPLAEDGRVARVRAAVPPPASAPRRLRFVLAAEVTNVSTRAWPALAVATAHLVTLATRWTRPDGAPGPDDVVAGRLPFDLAPGASAPVEVGVHVPDAPGRWRLEIGVAQDGLWLAGDTLSVPIEVR
jgi:hypothetical protein